LQPDLIGRITDFWYAYQRIVLGVVGVVAAAGIIGFFTLQARSRAEAEAAGRLSEANAEYWQGNYQRSLASSQQVASQYGGTKAGRYALRLAADSQYWLGNLKDAIEGYRKYLQGERNPMLADAARRSLANALESERQFDEAARIYAEIAPRLDRESAADALAAAARCHRAAGRSKEAAELYRRVVNDYGETSQAAMARLYLAETTVPKLR
jgi:tetratricopeptide (TPR) repeat protein